MLHSMSLSYFCAAPNPFFLVFLRFMNLPSLKLEEILYWNMICKYISPVCPRLGSTHWSCFFK